MDKEIYHKSYLKYKEIYLKSKYENSTQDGGMRTFSSDKRVLNVDELFISTRYMKAKEFFVVNLEYVLDEVVWGDELGLTPRQVMRVKSMKGKTSDKLLRGHQKRIDNANFSFPILLMSKNMAEEFGFVTDYPYKYLVVDGVHRISKAHKIHKKKLMGILLTRDIIKEALIKL
jgi:hypothetical protein